MNSSLLQRILRRKESLFQADLEMREQEIADTMTGARILVIGAAGSIGSAFVKEVVRWRPAGLRLIDPSENNLVELVRDLRSSSAPVPEAFATSAIAMGSVEFERFLASEQPFDQVVNFAALKHVRAERDPFTLMRMLHVNVLALDDLLAALVIKQPKGFFSVSSDKAVQPANLMGASKALMEQVMWHWSDRVKAVTSRFANVAFSDGSLLYGLQRRLEKRQPIAAPVDVKRYFISHAEAGQLCLLACGTGHNREIFIPRLTPREDLASFAEIAVMFLEEMGYSPLLFDHEEQARAFANQMSPACREWPCCFSVSDTTGEKDEEIFSAPEEMVHFDRFAHVGVIANPPGQDVEPVLNVLHALRQLRTESSWALRDIIPIIRGAVPGLAHQDRGRNLDGKM
ncbi:MAG: polysaccharide biosynthesis protein [Magnetococcus sp. YQC-5]